MAQPIHINDGDFTRVADNGPPQYSHPFLNRGDGTSFECRVSRRVDATSYRKPVPMSQRRTKLGIGYLVDWTEASNVECGLLEWQETYASVPVKRIEPGSITYAYQFRATYGFGDDAAISEYSSLTACEYQYEYSLVPFPPRRAPRLVAIGTTLVGFGGWHYFDIGERIIAQDAEPDIYKGRIYMIRTAYIIWQGLGAAIA